MSREHLFSAFFFLVFAALLYQVWVLFAGFLEAAAWAAILALVFYPAYQSLLDRIRRPSLAAAAMTALIYGMVVLPALTLGGLAVQQSQKLYTTVQEAVESGEATEWLEEVRRHRLVQWVGRVTPGDLVRRADFPDLGLRASKSATEYLVGQLGGIARNVFSFLVSFFLMLVMLFFFFRDGERLYRSFRNLVPMEAENKDAIFTRFYETLSAVVQGMTVTAVVQGFLAGAAFAVLGVPFAALLAGASALASFVPIGGAALVWVPAMLWLLLQGSIGRAIALLVWGVAVISLADNLIRPIVIGNRTQIPTFFLFFGILGGLQAYGVLGVFVGPAILATIVVVFRIYREQYATEAPPGPPPGPA